MVSLYDLSSHRAEKKQVAISEKYLAANKRLYMAFVDLEKAFDRVPRKVIWWALRKLGVDEWIVHLVQGMYSNARSRVRVGEGYSEEFEVKVGVHQGSVLSPLLFIIVLEALSREFRCGVPWEDLYADDLVIIAESLEECVRRLLVWKEAMEEKGLRVNAGKTKIMICLQPLQKMLLLPTPVRQTAHGNSPELCRRSSPVPQIMIFVFPAFTLSPFSSIASFHTKSLLTHSSSDSAMITRSSA